MRALYRLLWLTRALEERFGRPLALKAVVGSPGAAAEIVATRFEPCRARKL